jgi:hypothetical protein
MLLISPIQYQRRQLHRFQPSKGGIRSNYGGTISLGYKKGTLINHKKYKLSYIGGNQKGRLNLHCVNTGKRVTTSAKPEDIIKIYSILPWRYQYKPCSSPS